MTDHTTAATHYIAQGDHARDLAELNRLREVNADLVAALAGLLQYVDAPEPNCSCHICPPCSDCVEYGGMREDIENARSALAKAEAK